MYMVLMLTKQLCLVMIDQLLKGGGTILVDYMGAIEMMVNWFS